MVEALSEKVSLNIVHTKVVRKWPTGQLTCFAYDTAVDIDVKSQGALGVRIRQSTAHDMEVVPDVSGRVAERVRYPIQVFVEGMAAVTGVNIPTVQRELGRALISASITAGSILVLIPTVQVSHY
jgi:hypothetical protein